MKKLLIACGVLFVIGCGLFTAGWLSGGILYAPYYDGGHPIHNPLQLLLPSYRHSLWWFDTADEIKEAVDDAFDEVGDAMDDVFDAVDSGLDDALDAVHEAVHDLY